jgi:hypothetical protein
LVSDSVPLEFEKPGISDLASLHYSSKPVTSEFRCYRSRRDKERSLAPWILSVPFWFEIHIGFKGAVRQMGDYLLCGIDGEVQGLAFHATGRIYDKRKVQNNRRDLLCISRIAYAYQEVTHRVSLIPNLLPIKPRRKPHLLFLLGTVH